MVSIIGSFDDSFHNIFDCGVWNIEKVKKYFGDTPTILTSVLERRSCSVDVIKLLLKQGADINCQNDSGYCPLMMALKITNDEGVIRELLEGGADVNKVDNFGKTPLLMFLHREDCSVGIVQVLLDFKADVNRMDKYGDFPLAAAIRKSKDDAIIRLLVERGAKVNRNFKNTPLLMLLLWDRINCPVDTVKLFLSEGANINCVDKDGNSPLVTALKKQDEAVIQTLLENGANVNMVNKSTETPLLLYLNRYFVDNCSIDIVKLLLHHKANVNSRNCSGSSPLTTALRDKRGETIIRMLLEGGANVNIRDRSGRSPLCLAFKHSSNDIVKLLLDAGSFPNACNFHSFPLRCATDFSCSGLREDILKLLLERDVSVNNDVLPYDRSILCFALHHGAKAHDIQLLLDAGALLNACKRHSSPLNCATDGLHDTPLRKDVLQLLLDNGASVGDYRYRILSGALERCRYETEAIQLLFDLPGMDAYVAAKYECDGSLLHVAVKNPNCRLDAMKLLVDRKAQVHSENQWGDTPLHCALRFDKCNRRVINFLLKNGSPVNAKNKSDETPLMVAVKVRRPANILKELLIAGAHIGNTKFSRGGSTIKYELLEFLARQWEPGDNCTHREPMNSYKMLMKFFLLQNPECDVENYLRCEPVIECRCIDKIMTFLNECRGELRIMDSFLVGHGHTFGMLVRREWLSVDKMFDVDQILICLINYMFPVFFDVISARIGRSIMEAVVKDLHVYYIRKNRPNLLFSQRIHLNSEVVLNISKYLPDDDLLKFILAFYRPVNQNNSGLGSKDHTLLGRRNSESFSNPHKYLKTTHCQIN